MGIALLLGVPVIFVISLMVTAAIIRHSIDSSRTSSKLDELLDEIRALRRELKVRNDQKDTHIKWGCNTN